MNAARSDTMLKCMWRCSRVTLPTRSVEALMQATQQVRWTFHLSEDEHRAVCEEALRRGEQQLAADLYELETRA